MLQKGFEIQYLGWDKDMVRLADLHIGSGCHVDKNSVEYRGNMQLYLDGTGRKV